MARKRRYRGQRVKPTPPNPLGRSNTFVESATTSGQVLLLGFDQPVALDGLPNIGLSPNAVGAVVVSASQIDPQNVRVNYDQSLASATTLVLVDQDPAIKTRTGGFVVSRNFPVT